MGGQRVPGPAGTEAVAAGEVDRADSPPPGAGFARPGPIGIEPAAPLGVTRIIANVTKDWEPPAPATTPEIVVEGGTLAEAGKVLDRLPEWGEGGGMIRAERIPPGTSTNLTVALHANLVMRLLRWTGYAKASAGAKAEWDRMIVKLRAHEERHVAIAIEEADALAVALIGREISEIAAMVTEANRAMQTRQDQLDMDTDNGARAGVPYGDVILDTSIT